MDNILLLLYIYFLYPTYFQKVTSELNSTAYLSHLHYFRELFFKVSKSRTQRKVREAD